MTDPGEAIQVAVAAALLAEPSFSRLLAQTSLGPALFDPMQGDSLPDAYPRVELGEDQVLGDTTSCSDGSEVFVTLHIWATGPNGRLVAKRIAGAARSVLAPAPDQYWNYVSPSLQVGGHEITAHEWIDTKAMTDPDGLTAHVVATVHYFTNPSP